MKLTIHKLCSAESTANAGIIRKAYSTILQSTAHQVAVYGFLEIIVSRRAGLTNATLQAIYEYFIVLKTREIRNSQSMRQV